MKKMISILLLAVMLFALAGCDTYAMFNRYPDDRSTVWYCEEIDFEIWYVPNAYGNLEPQNSPLAWNGVTYTVWLGFHAGYFVMYSYKSEGPYTENDILISGEWRFEDDNMVFEIEEDNIFNNTFEELVFKPEARNAE